MLTVTRLAKTTKVWDNNHSLKPKLFAKTNLNSDTAGILSTKDEVYAPSIMGTLVDLATRCFVLKAQNYDKIAKRGAAVVDYLLGNNIGSNILFCGQNIVAFNSQRDITNIDDADFMPIAEMAWLETQYRYPRRDETPEDLPEIDHLTAEHIKIMLLRAKNFFNHYGKPTVADYDVKNKDGSVWGDGDFLSNSYLVDFKTYASNVLLAKNNRQLMMYYVLGVQEKKYPEFASIDKLVYYNPRTDEVYEVRVDDIPDDVKKSVLDTANNPYQMVQQ